MRRMETEKHEFRGKFLMTLLWSQALFRDAQLYIKQRQRVYESRCRRSHCGMINGQQPEQKKTQQKHIELIFQI